MFVPRNPWRREPTESLNEPQEEDLDRLAELREQGSRLNLPHPVRGFLRLDSERAAREVAGLLGKAGFSCRVRAGQDGSWVTVAIRQLVPTPGGITRLREQLEAAVAPHGGTYLGWDAPVVY